MAWYRFECSSLALGAFDELGLPTIHAPYIKLEVFHQLKNERRNHTVYREDSYRPARTSQGNIKYSPLLCKVSVVPPPS